MQITCKQCNTAYVYDDKLIHPTGTPVQCTRCGFVFTVKPNASAPPAPNLGTTAASESVQEENTPARSAGTKLSGGGVQQASKPPKSETMVFGRGASRSSGEAKNSVRVGNATQMFGAVPTAQASANSPASSPPASSQNASSQNEGARTIIFGKTAKNAESRPIEAAAPESSEPEPASPAPMPNSGVSDTLMMEAIRDFPAGPGPSPTGGQASEPYIGPSGAVSEASGVSKEPEPGADLEAQAEAAFAAGYDERVAHRAHRRPLAPTPLPVERVGAQTMQLQVALKRRQRRGPIIAGAVALVVVVVGGIALLISGRPPSIDPRVVAADARALDLMKMDDETSLKNAISYWEKLEPSAPEFVPIKVNQVIARSFLALDARDESSRITGLVTAAGKEKRTIEERKETNDWSARSEALKTSIQANMSQINQLNTLSQSLGEKAYSLLIDSKKIVERHGVEAEDGSWHRAAALYYSTRGSETVEKLVGPYRNNRDERHLLHDESRAFGDLAMAAYYAQSRTDQEWRAKGIAAAEAALKKDPKLLRAYVFLAKIHLAGKEYGSAKKTLNKLLELNPNHQAGRKLLGDVEKAEKGK